MSSGGDLAHALRLVASGHGVGEVWREAGFRSRKELADAMCDLASRLARKPLRVIAYSDGASIGNPGDAGCGVVITDEAGQVLLEDQAYLGRGTNNAAEYEGAILALEKARDLGATKVELRVDSALLANQIKGGFRVKSKNLARFYLAVRELSGQFEEFEVTLIGRSQNAKADRLANLAIAMHRGKAGAG